MFKNLYQLFLVYLSHKLRLTIYAKNIPALNKLSEILLYKSLVGLATLTYYVFLLSITQNRQNIQLMYFSVNTTR